MTAAVIVVFNSLRCHISHTCMHRGRVNISARMSARLRFNTGDVYGAWLM